MSIRLILDTDIDTDCDDAGALAVLHALAQRGAVELLGVVCSVPVPWCVPCVRAINAAYGRDDLPVGAVSVPDWDTHPAYADYIAHRRRATENDTRALYNQRIAAQWAERLLPREPEEAVSLYRRLLCQQPSGSVTICAIGTLTALAQLLDSGPDVYSPLTGRELVADRVRLLVTMALGAWPQGRDGFNWRMDWPAAAQVVNTWPTPLAVSEWGSSVLTGARFMASAPEHHPVAVAYRTFLGSVDRNRPSWDLLAALYAVCGAGEWFAERRGCGLTLDPVTRQHRWEETGTDSSVPERIHLSPRAPDEALAETVEDLMIAGIVSIHSLHAATRCLGRTSPLA